MNLSGFKANSMEPKISIIIVVFNAAKTIEASIDSAIRQSYQNKELIAIDGGSYDGTLEILKKIEHPNFSFTSEPDQGIYDAMNKGIRRATGEWLYFLGADDLFYDKKVLENIFTESDLIDADFLYGNVKRSDHKKPYDGEFNFKKLLEKNISHQAVFYKKTVFEKNGRYNIKYKTHADWDLNLRCFENKDVRIKYTNSIIATFGIGGVSANYDIPFLRESLMPRKMEFLKANKNLLSWLKNYDEYWRFIRNAHFRTEKDFEDSGYHSAVPAVIFFITKLQNKLPESLLRNGIFSKITMSISYLFSDHKIKY